MGSPSFAITLAHAGLVFFLVGAGRFAFERSMPLGARGAMRRMAFLGLALAWLGATWSLAKAGLLYEPGANPPRFVFLMGPAVVGTLALCWSPFARRVLDTTPMAWIVGFQAFRLPVELILWGLHREGLLTQRMTFEGSNPEWVTLLLLPLAWWAARKGRARWFVFAWNAVGLATLATIVTIAVRTMPGPWQRFTEEPGNAIVLTSSFVWIPCVYVLTALASHVLIFRALVRPSAER
ncbi:MAG: hypothetical protein IPJ77_08280 [Planctomycetes bacterium]|nr:hypothetical protein [Planctomycetota bacterium]